MDTDKLKPYRMLPLGQVTSEQDVGKYLSTELRRIEQAIQQLVDVLKKLETRMSAHGI